MDVGAIVAVGGALMGVIGWLFNIKGRVDTHDVLHSSHERAHEQMRDDLRYVRERIDRAINGR